MKRENFYSILFISISIFLFFLFISPKKSSLSALEFQALQKRHELETSDRYFQEILKAHEKLKNYQEEISKIESAIPEDPSLPSLFNFLQRSSSQSGLLLEGIGSVSSREEEGKLKKWTTTIRLKGDYSSLKNFLSVLEKSTRLIKVEGVSLQGGEPMVFDLTISFFSY
jgi:Tfp pilus assembly protein PilO